MPRMARMIGVGLPHHITQRGNHGQPVFRTDADRRYYLKSLAEYGGENGVSVLAYCLMSNHIHIIAVPEQENSFYRAFNMLNMRYSRYCNAKTGEKGHLWQERYYSCLLDNTHLLAAARYVERNPVKAGLVKDPLSWQWSSAAAHCGGGTEYNLDLEGLWDLIDIKRGNWSGYISEPDTEADLELLRKHTHSGRPLGGSEFIKALEERSGRILHARRVGRPRNTENCDNLEFI